MNVNGLINDKAATTATVTTTNAKYHHHQAQQPVKERILTALPMEQPRLLDADNQGEEEKLGHAKFFIGSCSDLEEDDADEQHSNDVDDVNAPYDETTTW